MKFLWDFIKDLNWKSPVTIGIALVVLFVLYQVVGGFVWFIIQTIIYVALFMGLLFFLKKKGFFKS